MEEYLREVVAKEYGVKIRSKRVDWYCARCGHICVVYRGKTYHLNVRPTLLRLRYF